MSRTTLNLSGKRGKILTFAIREGYYFFSVSGLCFVLGGERRVEKGERTKASGECGVKTTGRKSILLLWQHAGLRKRGLDPDNPCLPEPPDHPDPGTRIRAAMWSRP